MVPEKLRFPELKRVQSQISKSGRSLLNLKRYVNLGRAKNPPALFFLHEEYGSEVLALPFFLQRNTCVSSERNFAVSLCFANLSHGSHNGGMVEVFAGVLAACHR